MDFLSQGDTAMRHDLPADVDFLPILTNLDGCEGA